MASKSTTATNRRSTGSKSFTNEERAAMKDRGQQLTPADEARIGALLKKAAS